MLLMLIVFYIESIMLHVIHKIKLYIISIFMIQKIITCYVCSI